MSALNLPQEGDRRPGKGPMRPQDSQRRESPHRRCEDATAQRHALPGHDWAEALKANEIPDAT
mgnify:CR=1 FL=1